MQNGVFFSILSLIYCIITCILFFTKEKIKTEENQIYGKILVTNLIGLFVEIFTGLFLIRGIIPASDMVISVFLKLILVYFIIWTSFFTYYICDISINSKPILKILKYSFIFLGFFSSVMIFILKLEYYYKSGAAYSYGEAANFTYGISGVYVLIILTLLCVNFKKIFQQKYYPLFVFLFLGVIAILIQYQHPELTLVLSMHTIVTMLMYHTIENPDIKLVEYERNEVQRAEAASLAKSEFLSNMSHELRTPLNAIVGLSEDIESFKEQLPKDVQEDCKDIINASNTLLEIIGGILDISKIESGKLDIIDCDYDPREEFESLAKLNRTKFSEKNLEFNVSIGDTIPKVLFGDKLRIKQIVNNLLSNAYKYTDSGRVNFNVTWLAASQSLRIVVSDTGRGVKKEDLEKLFAKYDRLGVEKQSSVQGTGLGLNITKTLVELMGGNISVDSEYLVGTTFTIVLPQTIGSEEELERLKRESEYKIENLDFTGKRLLVVDDNLLNIKVLKKAVKSMNFEVEECYNGKEALAKVELNNNYDLILLDIRMPVMDGEEAIKNLRNMPNFKSPVIALTADAIVGAKERYVKMGFDDYLSKPFSREMIAKKFSSIFNKKEEPKEAVKPEENHTEETNEHHEEKPEEHNNEHHENNEQNTN